MEEFEAREKIKIAQLEEEIRKAEQEKHEEIRGKTNKKSGTKINSKFIFFFFFGNRAY